MLWTLQKVYLSIFKLREPMMGLLKSSKIFAEEHQVDNALKVQVYNSFGLVFYQGITAQLKNTLARLKVLQGQGCSSDNPQSQYPNLSAESTKRECIDSAEQGP